MNFNLNNTNDTIIIKFSGIVKDFDGYEAECEWDIPSNPNEKIENLLSKFFQISGLNKDNYRLQYNRGVISKKELTEEQAAVVSEVIHNPPKNYLLYGIQ